MISRSRASIWDFRCSSLSRLSPLSAFMAATRSARLSRTMKSAPWFLNASTGAGAPLLVARLRGHQPALAGEVRILLRARQREFLLDDALRQHEPRIIVAGAHDVLQLAERIGAGKQRRGQPLAGGVEPHRRRSGQDADAVARPDRLPVPDALDIVPHPVAVDQPRAGGFGDADHAAVDMFGHAGDHVLRRFAKPLRPVLPDQVVIAADAAGSDDHGLRVKREVADDFARTALAALDGVRLEDRAADAVDGAVGDR